MKRLALGLFVAAFVSVVGGVMAQAMTPKYWVDHKGSWICVDDDSVDAHLGHGDYTELEPCD